MFPVSQTPAFLHLLSRTRPFGAQTRFHRCWQCARRPGLLAFQSFLSRLPLYTLLADAVCTPESPESSQCQSFFFFVPSCAIYVSCCRRAHAMQKHRLSSGAAGSGSEKAGRCRMRQKQLSEAQRVCFCRMHSGSFLDFRSLPGAKQTNDFLAWCVDGASTSCLALF